MRERKAIGRLIGLSLGWALLASPAAAADSPAALQSTEPALAPVSDHLPPWIDLGAEYRVRSLFVNPYELNGTTVRDTNWTEQRLRLDLALKHPGVVKLVVQLDVLDGVLFGDNGEFGKDPSPFSGVSIASKRPNNTAWELGLLPGRDPLDPRSYAPSLKGVDAIEVNHAYGEVSLPFGVLRVGRQPLNEGAGVSAHDGGRHNRWGVSSFHDTADRVLFGTKLDEAIMVLTHGRAHKVDSSLHRGVLLAGFYDWQNQGAIYHQTDDTAQMGASIQWRQDEAGWFDTRWRDFKLALTFVHARNDRFNTRLYAFPFTATANIGAWSFLVHGNVVRGNTREVSEGFAVLSSGEAKRQKLAGQAVQAVVDWRWGPLTATLEFDYSSGDDDPRPGGSITSFSYARDLNVGLLLFEHILAFESARATAVGIENLSSLDAESFPITEVSTEGRFTNAIAFFPQLDVAWIDSARHHFHTRFGALFAWTNPGGVVDPIQTILAVDGNDVADDAVNFHGGDPGSYYGTELDLQLEWTWRQYFKWTVEAAVLFPGDALQDAHGDAVTAFFVENRFLFIF